MHTYMHAPGRAVAMQAPCVQLSFTILSLHFLSSRKARTAHRNGPTRDRGKENLRLCVSRGHLRERGSAA